MNIVVTDVHYRMTVAAVRDLLEAGHSVTLVHAENSGEPLCFYLEGDLKRFTLSADQKGYKNELLKLLREIYPKPCLMLCGAFSIGVVAENREEFEEVADFLLPPAAVLDLANDKQRMAAVAREAGILTPEIYEPDPQEVASSFAGRLQYPVVIKYVCGEKLGFKAAERYFIANNRREFSSAYRAMKKNGEVIVQRYIEGEGVGCSLLIGRGGELVSFICHRRIREYPVSGGPSTCCESIYDRELVDISMRLTKAIGFVGICMCEFKKAADGYYFLEINPRLWGSFPLTRAAGAPFSARFCDAAAGRAPKADSLTPQYQSGVRMRFLFSDLAAAFSMLKKGRWRDAAEVVFGSRGIRDGLFEKGGGKVTRAYIKSLFAGKRRAKEENDED